MWAELLHDQEEAVLILEGLVDFDDVRVIEDGHNFDLVDEDSRVFDSSLGDAFDDPQVVWEGFLTGLINDAIGPSADFLRGSGGTLMN